MNAKLTIGLFFWTLLLPTTLFAQTSADVLAELQTEIARLQAEETSLSSNLGEQNNQISDLHAEIERLTALVDAMQATKAWRWHQRFESLKGNP